MQNSETKQRILDTAERLFAQNGIEGTSVRTITAAAGVNVAAIHYHFGSKEALAETVYSRRLQPINSERLRLLSECFTPQTRDDLCLEDIIKAFIGPLLRLKDDPEHGGGDFMHLMGRIYSEPGDFKLVILGQFKEVAQQFTEAFAQALPHLSRRELYLRLHFTLGAMAHTVVAGEILTHFSSGESDVEEIGDTIDRLTTFLAAGLRASRNG